MAVFVGGFRTVEDIIEEFHISPDALKGATILFASYLYEYYDGSAFVLFEQDGKLYEVNGSHCSCYGLEHQWEPEETSVAAVWMRKDITKPLHEVLDQYEAGGRREGERGGGMTNHDTNRAIAEKLSVLGFSEKLAPRDFADPCYLFPTLEAYCAEYQMLFRCFPSDGGAVWFARIHHAQRIGEIFDGDGPTLGVALRNALAAALGVTGGGAPS